MQNITASITTELGQGPGHCRGTSAQQLLVMSGASLHDELVDAVWISRHIARVWSVLRLRVCVCVCFQQCELANTSRLELCWGGGKGLGTCWRCVTWLENSTGDLITLHLPGVCLSRHGACH